MDDSSTTHGSATLDEAIRAVVSRSGRARHKADELVRLRVATDRFLARAFVPGETLAVFLRGGANLLARFSPRVFTNLRVTNDIDLTVYDDVEPMALIAGIAQRDVGDGFRFVPILEPRDQSDRGPRRIKGKNGITGVAVLVVPERFAEHEWQQFAKPFSIEISTSHDAPAQAKERTELISPCRILDYPVGWQPPAYRALRMEYQLADKVVALTTPRESGLPSNRHRDLWDAAFFSWHTSLEATAARHAIRSTYVSDGFDPHLSVRLPVEGWERPFNRLSRKASADVADAPSLTFWEAAYRVGEFINPLLNPDAVTGNGFGWWNPARGWDPEATGPFPITPIVNIGMPAPPTARQTSNGASREIA